MIPNWFEDSSDSPEYNSVDATLWLFEAVRSYLVWTGDVEFVSRYIYPRLIEAIDWHVRGTRYGIHGDGIRCHGSRVFRLYRVLFRESRHRTSVLDGEERNDRRGTGRGMRIGLQLRIS